MGRNREDELRLERIQRARTKRKRRRRRKGGIFRIFYLLLFLCTFVAGIKLVAGVITGEKKTPKQPVEQPLPKAVPSEPEQTDNIVVSDNKWLPRLQVLLLTEPRVFEIILQIDDYPDRILELLLKNPDTIEFALAYPKLKNTTIDIEKIKITEQEANSGLPLFLQWDNRWSCVPYGNGGIIALDGCGPTCLSMVMVGLSKDSTWNPAKMAKFSLENGFVDDTNGTSWQLMTKGAEKLGLTAKELPLVEGVIKKNLQEGKPVICSMGPGDFTNLGHFVVLYAYEDGKFRLHDPNNRQRSEKQWEYSVLAPQIKNLWAFSYEG